MGCLEFIRSSARESGASQYQGGLAESHLETLVHHGHMVPRGLKRVGGESCVRSGVFFAVENISLDRMM